MLNTIIIQPPLVQLNTPYPSGAYLSAFFKKIYKEKNLCGQVKWFDLSTDLFHSIFSKKGLSLIFEKSRANALKIANQMESQGDDNSAFQLRRYVSQSQQWCNWIETIVSIVCPKTNISGREFTHEFVRSAHAPRGSRMENHLANLNRDVTTDDTQILASLALADLADYITASYDSNFSLIRYAEHLATSTSNFQNVLDGLSSPILNEIYKPLLEEKLKSFSGESLFLISVPFPGCFEAALFSAKIIRSLFGKSAIIAMGGGYINTELRSIKEPRLFDFCDFLSYDKGYGSYLNLFDEIELSASTKNFSTQIRNALNGKEFYKTKYKFTKDDNFLIVNQLETSAEYELKERKLIHSLIPDFSDIDFSRSPRLADDQNPMHRIWNDGAWIKAYMAYGCYWHRCAFCDTSLDYVSNFCSTDISSFYDGIYAQAKKAGVYGIHFVDEACPPIALQSFALKNILKSKESQKLTFWGNIRFEKTFSRDLADLLSYGGLTAVSAGIEIATGNGLNSVNKGIDMENIVSACCAFKEAGILIHSYMIFGFWNQTDQDLINSMETLRQLFANGLLDSAFWHKFTLTKHSTVYREWLQGKHPELKPSPQKKSQFAENDIHWEGEHKSEKFSKPLNNALECWMHGEKLNKAVQSYFPFKMPAPTIQKDYIEKLVQKYEQKRDAEFSAAVTAIKSKAEAGLIEGSKRFIWLGGEPLILKSSCGTQLCWSHMGELLYADISTEKSADITILLNSIKAENFQFGNDNNFYENHVVSILGKKLFKELRGKGLCRLI